MPSPDKSVIGVTPAIVGSVEANEVLKLICGYGEPLAGKLWTIDLRTMQSYILSHYSIHKDMKLIVITTPQFFEGEAAAVTSLFQNGLEILHLRKPGASAEEMEYFLRQLPMEYMPRIVTHQQFQLASVFGLKGIHLNGRNPQIPSGYKEHVSRSVTLLKKC